MKHHSLTILCDSDEMGLSLHIISNSSITPFAKPQLDHRERGSNGLKMYKKVESLDYSGSI